MTRKSLFIITIGPAGSGKGYIIDKLKQKVYDLYTDLKKSDLQYVRIDDYVESDSKYVELVLDYLIKDVFPNRNFINYIEKNNNIKSAQHIVGNVIKNKNIDPNLKQLETVSGQISNFYFEVRKNWIKYHDAQLDIHLINRDNIVFETTGVNNFDWLLTSTLLSDPEIRNSYKIILVYPFVDSKIILARAFNRFTTRIVDLIKVFNIAEHKNSNKEQYLNIINNIAKKNKINDVVIEAPRIPTLFSGNYSLFSSIVSIQNNIASYINRCLQHENLIDSFILFDNELKEPIISTNLDCKVTVESNIDCSNLNSFYIKYNNKLTHALLDALSNIIDTCPETNQSNNIYNHKYQKYYNKLDNLKNN